MAEKRELGQNSPDWKLAESERQIDLVMKSLDLSPSEHLDEDFFVRLKEAQKAKRKKTMLEKFIHRGMQKIRCFEEIEDEKEMFWPCMCGGVVKWVPHSPFIGIEKMEEYAPFCETCETLFEVEYHAENRACITHIVEEQDERHSLESAMDIPLKS